ncbi:MAG TPA: hypothetical protein VGM56_16175 [Byssovorax sp.]
MRSSCTLGCATAWALVVVTYPARHMGGMGSYKEMPTWAQWRPKAIALIEAQLAKKP